MSGLSKNNLKKEVAPNSIFSDVGGLVTSSTSWDQGDILVFDDTANKVKALSAEADGLTVLGCAIQGISNGVVVGPYTGITDNTAAIQSGALAGPLFGCEFELVLKTGDTVNPGDLVYGFDAKTVQAAGTKAIGIYLGKAVVTAVAGQTILCRIGARFPQDTLRL